MFLQMQLGDIQKVRSLKISKFWPLPLFRPCLFSTTPFPFPNVRSLWLELILFPSFSIVKFRENKLIMSTSIFGWTQRVF